MAAKTLFFFTQTDFRMKISYNWLKQHISSLPAPAELSQVLTQLGLEVEGTETTGVTKERLNGLKVGEVMECIPHPNADKLKITKVDAGTGELLNIVCGAPNVKAGQKVIVAPVGTMLYPVEGEPFKIKKSKIRGEESNGMLCAEDEIGIGKSHEGLLILPDESPVGSDVADHLILNQDTVFEIGITPNHGDACSHLGIAREIYAAFVLNENKAELKYNFGISPVVNFGDAKNAVKVTVHDPGLCPRYAGVFIKGIKVSPSPAWLLEKLQSIGLKPINNIVDITNYVLHDIGQPIHAFDADKLEGNKIEVRLAASGEKIITLDGVERILKGTELLICDASKPLAIAGVFGGAGSGVSEGTVNVFIESAYFNPAAVRRSAKAHGLNTDASFRFERGTDPEIAIWAALYTASLILDIAGGEAAEGIIDEYPVKIAPSAITLRYSRLEQVTGVKAGKDIVKKILEGLNIRVAEENETQLIAKVPSYKIDVTQEIDLCEEVLRVYGINHVPLPGSVSIPVQSKNEKNLFSFREKISAMLASRGFHEIMSNSLVPASANSGAVESVQIINPLSQEMNVLRNEMLGSGLEAIAYNLNRGNHRLRLFENGKTYYKKQDKFIEEEHLAIYLVNKPEKWNALQPVDIDGFYLIKATVEETLASLGIENISYKESVNPSVKTCFDVEASKINLGYIGEIKSSVLKNSGIGEPVYYADLLLSKLKKAAPQGYMISQPVPKFPSVRRDLSLLLDEKVSFQDLKSTAMKTERYLLRDIGVFDIYQGNKLEKGKKSYALYFILQDEERTMEDKTISGVMARLQKALESEWGAVVR
jgi:phenylalanyl-tRNA synthetase beta chain